MPPRLPIPGSDDNTWGQLLNGFLNIAHNSDGTLKTSSIGSGGGALTTNNLSDLQSATSARGNLGLGTAAVKNVGTTSGTVAAGDDGRISGAIQASSLTAKGDLLVATSAGVTTRLGVGSDAQVLTADSTQVTGLKWSAVSAAPVTLTDGATITTNAALSRHFRVTLGGNRILANPTNPTDGQRVLWELAQDGTGSRTIVLDTAFNLGGQTLILSTGAGKVDYLGAIYRGVASKWDVIALPAGTGGF
jgi:hypothetical protein